MADLAALMRRLEQAGTVPVALTSLTALPWLERVPRDYAEFSRRFGGGDVRVSTWTIPAASRWAALHESFVEGGPPGTLVPFAEQDGTWFMAFDLAAGARLVEWDHEECAAKPVKGTFADWLAEQLDDDQEIEAEEREWRLEQQRLTNGYLPFCDTPLGRHVSLRLASAAGATLRDVLLDLHLQYTFHPKVVVQGGLRYLGLLHFTHDAIGCWRCGRMNGRTATSCPGCGEASLLRTLDDAQTARTEERASAPCFGVWAAEHVDVDAPKPVLVTGGLNVNGIPKWARLVAFGGTRDPRIRSH